MDMIIEWLRPSETLISIWRLTVLICVVYLLGLGFLMLAARQVTLEFLSGFGSNVVLNSLEGIIRSFAGLAVMGTAPDNRFPVVAFSFGVMLVVTSIGILLLPGLHRWYGVWSMRIITPVLPLYGILSILLGIFVLYSVYWGTFDARNDL